MSAKQNHTDDWTRRFATLLVEHRTAVMILLVIFTSFLGYFMVTRLSLRVVLEEMVPPQSTEVKLYKRFSPVFGGVNTSLFAMKVKQGAIYQADVLKTYQQMSDDIYFYKDTDRFSVQSLTLKKTKLIAGEAGAIRIQALMWPDVPTQPEELEQTRLEARRLYGGQLVSLDDTMAVIIASFKPDVDYTNLYQFTRDLKKKYENQNIELHMVGRPIILGWISHYMYEMMVIFALSFALITAVCWFYFRSLIGVFVPLIKALLTTIWGFGFIAMVGYNVNPLMLLLPFFVFATILSHAVQIMSRFYEEYARLGDFDQALIESLAALLRPSFSAILTDAMGFSVLYLAKIPTLQILAILCTIWLLSITVAVTFSAAAFFVIPMPEKLTMYGRDMLNRITAKIATYERARTVLVCTGVVLIAAFILSTRVITGDPTPGSPIFWPDAEYNRSAAAINTTFTNLGTDVMQVYVQGPEATMVSPSVYRLIEGLERYLRERIPEFGGVQTLVPIVKQVNAVLNEGDPSYEYVPKSPEAVGMNIYFFRSRGDPNDMDIFADKEWKNGNLTFFLKDHKHATLEKVTAAVREYFSSVGTVPDVKFYYPGGQGGLIKATNEEIESGHLTTVAVIVTTIMIVIYVTYRSLAAALILMVMLLLADFLSLTYMYFAGIGLNLDTMPIAAIGMGRGVDYGIYLIDRIKAEYAKCRDVHLACRVAIDTTGSAIIFTAMTMVVPLIPWYFISSLRFQGQMGLLLAMILFWHAVGAIIYLTAAIVYFKPKSILRVPEEEEEEIQAVPVLVGNPK